ncbi:hypothetical protein ElyMa_005516300 [Elysia marginata]|uniref:Secreted protein n=1 Tax=Elysia marginata TaxID=1093978 RepID=A0AAV4EUN5_9GAST|nr:hypothetical protein ElyMa_005516300 [Elysia marginata]
MMKPTRLRDVAALVELLSLTVCVMSGGSRSESLSFTAYSWNATTGWDLESREVLFRYEEPSPVRCVAACYRHAGSETAVFSSPDGSAVTCVCLGPVDTSAENRYQETAGHLVFYTWVRQLQHCYSMTKVVIAFYEWISKLNLSGRCRSRNPNQE